MRIARDPFAEQQRLEEEWFANESPLRRPPPYRQSSYRPPPTPPPLGDDEVDGWFV